jgi:hypothetical protein
VLIPDIALPSLDHERPESACAAGADRQSGHDLGGSRPARKPLVMPGYGKFSPSPARSSCHDCPQELAFTVEEYRAAWRGYRHAWQRAGLMPSCLGSQYRLSHRHDSENLFDPQACIVPPAEIRAGHPRFRTGAVPTAAGSGSL